MTSPPDPRLSVIIVNYNTREWLTRCLHSLERQSIRDEIEIIIVDNASSDGSSDMIRASPGGITTTSGMSAGRPATGKSPKSATPT